MARRRTIVGGIFASLDRLGWAKSRLRGLWKVDCEGFMASIAHNVLKTVRRLGSGTGSPEPSGSGGYAQLPPSLHGRKLKIHPRPSPFHHQKQTFSTGRRKWASRPTVKPVRMTVEQQRTESGPCTAGCERVSGITYYSFIACNYMMLVQPGRSNAMTVVAIVNQKDGVGKTTLAWSLARTGTMLLVNAGPQGSARDWNPFNITGPEGLFVQSHPTCSSCADAIPCLSNPPTPPRLRSSSTAAQGSSPQNRANPHQDLFIRQRTSLYPLLI